MVITSELLILGGRLGLLPRRKEEAQDWKFLQNSSTI